MSPYVPNWVISVYNISPITIVETKYLPDRYMLLFSPGLCLLILTSSLT